MGGKTIWRMQDAPDPSNERDIAAARGCMLRRNREAKNIQWFARVGLF